MVWEVGASCSATSIGLDGKGSAGAWTALTSIRCGGALATGNGACAGEGSRASANDLCLGKHRTSEGRGLEMARVVLRFDEPVLASEVEPAPALASLVYRIRH